VRQRVPRGLRHGDSDRGIARLRRPSSAMRTATVMGLTPFQESQASSSASSSALLGGILGCGLVQPGRHEP
jgi:hypothetical protein